MAEKTDVQREIEEQQRQMMRERLAGRKRKPVEDIIEWGIPMLDESEPEKP